MICENRFTPKNLEALRKKDFGTRFVVMQARAQKREACRAMAVNKQRRKK